MGSKRRKDSRAKDLTSRYMDGDVDEDRIERKQRFTDRAKHYQQNKTMNTTLARARAAESERAGTDEGLPVGQVIQIHSLFSEVIHEGVVYLCVVRKTL